MSLCSSCERSWNCLLCDKTGKSDVVVCKDYQPITLGKHDVVTDGFKHDGGKPMLALVPPALIRAVGAVMTHGAKKYGVGNWKKVEVERYRHAMARHYCDYLEDPYGVDKDSGLPHLYHLACNVAFLLELEKEGEQK